MFIGFGVHGVGFDVVVKVIDFDLKKSFIEALGAIYR